MVTQWELLLFYVENIFLKEGEMYYVEELIELLFMGSKV